MDFNILSEDLKMDKATGQLDTEFEIVPFGFVEETNCLVMN